MFVVLMEVVHRIVVIPGSLLAGGMRGAGDDGALMHSPLGFSRPPHRRAGGPRTQVGSWVRSPLGFSRPPHRRAGGLRTQAFRCVILASSTTEYFGSALSVSKSNLAQLFKSTTAPD